MFTCGFSHFTSTIISATNNYLQKVQNQYFQQIMYIKNKVKRKKEHKVKYVFPLQSGANFRFFVWVRTDKKKNNVFVHIFYRLGQILKEISVDLLNQV